MKTLFYALSISMLTIGTAFAQQNAKGMIYEDINANGKYDKGETRLPNVAVSNGKEVVLTDQKGYYTLPVQEDNIIFVIKPSGYALAVDAENHPKFYYNYKPKGSPKLKFEGVAPTGKLPKQINFGLTKSVESPKFSAFVFGDPQPYNEQELDYFKRGIVDRIQQKNMGVFGISLGDLVGNDLSLHPNYKKVIGEMGLPWYNVIGNHDLNFDVEADSLSDESFERVFGPANYSFNYGNAHFIILDDVYYPNPVTGKGYVGGFRKDQLDFVENDLKLVPKDKLIVLSYHIPVNFKKNESFRDADRQRLFSILESFPNVLGLSAHTHYQRQFFYTKKDGWNGEKPFHEFNVGTTSGDWYSGQFDADGIPVALMRDGTPKGYVLLNIDDNKYTYDYQVVTKPSNYQIALYGADVVKAEYVKRYPVYANFFIGNENDVVEMRVDGGKWKVMDRASELDPTYSVELMEFDTAKKLEEGKRPSDAEVSQHLWKLKLPTLKPGKHTIEVRAVDLFGRTHLAAKDIEVI